MSANRTPLTREAWLELAVKELGPLFQAKAGIKLPKVKVTLSFPYGASATKALGQCLNRAHGESGLNEILINPAIGKPLDIVSTLAHELIHAYDDCKSKHGGQFIRIGGRFGFTKPWKSTPMSDELEAELTALVKRLPKFPHGRIKLKERKKQSTRMVKLECDCGFICRAAFKPLYHKGFPVHCDTPMRAPDEIYALILLLNEQADEEADDE